MRAIYLVSDGCAEAGTHGSVCDYLDVSGAKSLIIICRELLRDQFDSAKKRMLYSSLPWFGV